MTPPDIDDDNNDDHDHDHDHDDQCNVRGEDNSSRRVIAVAPVDDHQDVDDD